MNAKKKFNFCKSVVIFVLLIAIAIIGIWDTFWGSKSAFGLLLALRLVYDLWASIDDKAPKLNPFGTPSK